MTGIRPHKRLRLPLLVFMPILAVALMIGNAGALGRDDIPELPSPDGSGDTPEMVISMIYNAPATGPGKIKLSSLKGKVLMIDMFWSQCPHCKDHAPHMNDIYAQYKDKGFTVLALATDKPNQVNDVRGFIRETKVTYPVGFITNEVIAYFADSHNRSVPQMILFGPDGKMVKRWIGWTEEIGKEVRGKIQEQLVRLPVVKPGSKASSRDDGRKINRAAE
jgi:thiol-disulfide isomerase/thioredoxin